MIEWRAVYSDNTHLDQFAENGIENKYSDIDRTKLQAFDILHDGITVLRTDLSNKKRLIYRRRVKQRGPSGAKQVVYLVGYQENINGVNKQVVNHIYERVLIEQHDKYIGGEPEYYDFE